MNRNKAQQSTLPYTAIEAALCDVFGIGEDGLTNFRSRIRHLRNIGVPHNLPRPGPGRKIQHTLDQTLQLAFALCLEQYGVMPRLAADIGPDIVASVRWMRAGWSNPSDDWYAIFTRTTLPPDSVADLGMSYLLLPGLEQLQQRLEERFVDWKDDAVVVLNVSNLTRKVEQAFKERGG